MSSQNGSSESFRSFFLFMSAAGVVTSAIGLLAKPNTKEGRLMKEIAEGGGLGITLLGATGELLTHLTAEPNEEV